MTFLSYAREDSERANRIYSMINRPDRPVFYDKKSLVPGMDWREEIENKLNTCKLVLILFSHHIVEKEGFEQKEIRLALERSEMMPEGRIFIMPIRFDGATVPQKIARYQWLDIKGKVDFFEIEYYVDMAWSLITNNSSHEREDIAILRLQDIVMLMQGKNPDGDRVFTYLKLSILQLRAMKKVIIERGLFQPSDFGEVLVAGQGYPSIEIRERMAREYNIGELPPTTGTEQQPTTETEQQQQQQLQSSRDEFIRGYREAYLVIAGSRADVPLIQPPDIVPENSSPLREGIRQGIKEALASKGI